MAPSGCWTSCVWPAAGSLATTTRGGPPARATEMVPAGGDSNDRSSVPAWVTIIDGITVFSTVPGTPVHAPAAGTKTRAAASAGATRRTA